MSIFNKLKKNKSETDKQITQTQATSSLKPVSAMRGSVLLIKQPWVTEKAGSISSLRKYVFIVNPKANKAEIKKTLEAIYGVKIIDVKIIKVKGKRKRLGRSTGTTSAHKKAIITLKEGQKIDVMPT